MHMRCAPTAIVVSITVRSNGTNRVRHSPRIKSHHRKAAAMPSYRITEHIGPILSQIGVFSVGVLAVSAISFALARVVGGSSRQRRVVFYVSSVVGFACVLIFMSTRPLAH